ncbi:hypothetical protein HDV01_002604 [Terramyces sp. JEL0728]|nr:hypothetical protein HDV01_002604 [Terramyces sp. JEL0728]
MMNSNVDKQGFLFGEVVNKTITKFTDGEEQQVEQQLILITAFQISTNLNDLDRFEHKPIGYFKTRRNSPLQPSIREQLLVESLGLPIFGLFTTNHSQDSTLIQEFAFYNQTFELLKTDIANLAPLIQPTISIYKQNVEYSRSNLDNCKSAFNESIIRANEALADYVNQMNLNRSE